MEERNVQIGEPQDKEPDLHVTTAPAPMVERAFRLLDLLMVSEEGLALSELARALNMSKGSMHGLLKTLENSGVVEQHEDRLYVLGPRIYKLAAYVRGTGLRRLALPAMQRLVARIGETIFLGRVEQDSVHVIESVESGSTYLFPHIAVPRGTHMPLLAAASGRVVLANWPAERREAWLRKHPLPRFTEHSITDAHRFLATVEETACTGIAIDHEEYLAGVNAVAVPITGADGSLIAILCALGFTSHFDEEAMKYAGQHLQEEARIISSSLGMVQKVHI
ncbi:MAG: IclR family transcriptional regulator [Chloroflexi bacterium]|nr:IclR family transcriptional regulator [Chloroflexota bacterium]